MHHTLSFQIAPQPNGALGFAPPIDGVSLIDRVAQYESEIGTTPAGEYGGLIPEYYNYGPLDRYFLSQSDKAPSELSVLGLFECGALRRTPGLEGVDLPNRPMISVLQETNTEGTSNLKRIETASNA